MCPTAVYIAEAFQLDGWRVSVFAFLVSYLYGAPLMSLSAQKTATVWPAFHSEA
jgi:hypothetical protein